MAKTNAAFMSGVPELLVLRLLAREEMYGYQLVRAIRTVSEEAFDLAEGVVYLFRSSEGELITDSRARLEQLWLEHAERALRDNRTTFAILGVADLLRPNGPMDQLKAKGYEVREP